MLKEENLSFGKIAKKFDEFAGSSGTKFIVNQKISEYGEIRELDIDRKNKRIFVSVMLKGENSVIDFKIEKYKFIKKEGKSFFVFDYAECNREWLDRVLKKHIAGKPLPIPEQHIDFLKDFIEE